MGFVAARVKWAFYSWVPPYALRETPSGRFKAEAVACVRCGSRHKYRHILARRDKTLQRTAQPDGCLRHFLRALSLLSLASSSCDSARGGFSGVFKTVSDPGRLACEIERHPLVGKKKTGTQN